MLDLKSWIISIVAAFILALIFAKFGAPEITSEIMKFIAIFGALWITLRAKAIKEGKLSEVEVTLLKVIPIMSLATYSILANPAPAMLAVFPFLLYPAVGKEKKYKGIPLGVVLTFVLFFMFVAIAYAQDPIAFPLLYPFLAMSVSFIGIHFLPLHESLGEYYKGVSGRVKYRGLEIGKKSYGAPWELLKTLPKESAKKFIESCNDSIKCLRELYKVPPYREYPVAEHVNITFGGKAKDKEKEAEETLKRANERGVFSKEMLYSQTKRWGAEESYIVSLGGLWSEGKSIASSLISKYISLIRIAERVISEYIGPRDIHSIVNIIRSTKREIIAAKNMVDICLAVLYVCKRQSPKDAVHVANILNTHLRLLSEINQFISNALDLITIIYDLSKEEIKREKGISDILREYNIDYSEIQRIEEEKSKMEQNIQEALDDFERYAKRSEDYRKDRKVRRWVEDLKKRRFRRRPRKPISEYEYGEE